MFRIPVPARSIVLGAVLLASVPARGDDAPVRVRIDLSDLAAPAAAPSPRIRVPGDAGFAWLSLDEEEASPGAFQPPPFPDTALSPELFDDLMRRVVPEATFPGVNRQLSGRALDAWGPGPGVERTRQAVAFLTAAYAPRLQVAATLSGGSEPASRFAVSGASSLLPRRWTPVWWRREIHRHVAGYSLEVAQGAIVNRPIVAGVPEGGELYLRWSPGESASLLEVFAAEFSPLAAQRIDLSGVRNTPESNPMGVVELPRTAVTRLTTALVVPGRGATFEIPWGGAGPARTLTLTVAAPPEVPAPLDLGPSRFRVSRVAAAAAALEAGARESVVQDLVSKFQTLAGAEGGVHGLETTGDTFVAGEGSAAELERLRQEIVRIETSLSSVDVSLRLVRIAADGPKGDGAAGSWSVGKALSAPAAASLVGPNVTVTSSIRLPVVSGAPASVRVAVSTTGFDRLSSSVAQNAAGVQPESGAWFDGLFVERLRATARDGGGASLSLSGTISWVRGSGHFADLAFRTPIGLDGRTGPGGLDIPDARHVSIPLVATGESKLDVDVGVSAIEVKDSTPIVLGAISIRDDQGAPVTLLLLGAVRR